MHPPICRRRELALLLPLSCLLLLPMLLLLVLLLPLMALLLFPLLLLHPLLLPPPELLFLPLVLLFLPPPLLLPALLLSPLLLFLLLHPRPFAQASALRVLSRGTSTTALS